MVFWIFLYKIYDNSRKTVSMKIGSYTYWLVCTRKAEKKKNEILLLNLNFNSRG